MTPKNSHLLARCGFKSAIHTDNLYPGSDSGQKIENPGPEAVPDPDSGSGFNGFIPMKEIKFTYSLSSGPGGQNAQKTATKVDARFHLDSATWLTEEVKAAVRQQFSGQLTKDGYFVAKSDRTRSQILNQADVLQKMRFAIWSSVAQVETFLQKTQLSEVEEEKQRKQRLKAARERLREKRTWSQHKKDKRNNGDWNRQE